MIGSSSLGTGTQGSIYPTRTQWQNASCHPGGDWHPGWGRGRSNVIPYGKRPRKESGVGSLNIFS